MSGEFHNKYLHYYLFEDLTLSINIEVKLIIKCIMKGEILNQL
jgi:hypothetical protein